MKPATDLPFARFIDASKAIPQLCLFLSFACLLDNSMLRQCWLALACCKFQPPKWPKA